MRPEGTTRRRPTRRGPRRERASIPLRCMRCGRRAVPGDAGVVVVSVAHGGERLAHEDCVAGVQAVRIVWRA